jgi:hypothetical protein
MKRLLFWLAVIAAIFFCICLLSLFRPEIDLKIDIFSVWAGINIRESILTRGVVTIILTPVLGIPVYNAIFALIAMGSDQLPDNLFGDQVHKFRTGARILMIVACIGFIGLFGFLGYGALNGQSPTIGAVIAIGCAALCLFMIYILVWAFRYYVKIDGAMVEAMNLTMSVTAVPIIDLTKIERIDQSLEYHLHFQNGERLRISFFVRGLDDLFDTINTRLKGRP